MYISIAPDHKLQLMVDYDPAENYSGIGATLSINSNDPLIQNCQFNFDVGPVPPMPDLSCDLPVTTMPVSGFAGEDTPFNLSLAVPTNATEGLITICSSGDLGSSFEYYDITILDTGDNIRLIPVIILDLVALVLTVAFHVKALLYLILAPL